jgi:hypothetical protein
METDRLPLAERSAVRAFRAGNLPLEPRGARFHGDEFFRRCRMQRHGRVEIGLFGADLYGNSQKLGQFARILTKNMHAEDAVCHAITAREAIHLTFAGNPLATAL